MLRTKAKGRSAPLGTPHSSPARGLCLIFSPFSFSKIPFILLLPVKQKYIKKKKTVKNKNEGANFDEY